MKLQLQDKVITNDKEGYNKGHKGTVLEIRDRDVFVDFEYERAWVYKSGLDLLPVENIVGPVAILINQNTLTGFDYSRFDIVGIIKDNNEIFVIKDNLNEDPQDNLQLQRMHYHEYLSVLNKVNASGASEDVKEEVENFTNQNLPEDTVTEDDSLQFLRGLIGEVGDIVENASEGVKQDVKELLKEGGFNPIEEAKSEMKRQAVKALRNEIRSNVKDAAQKATSFFGRITHGVSSKLSELPELTNRAAIESKVVSIRNTSENTLQNMINKYDNLKQQAEIISEIRAVEKLRNTAREMGMDTNGFNKKTFSMLMILRNKLEEMQNEQDERDLI